MVLRSGQSELSPSISCKDSQNIHRFSTLAQSSKWQYSRYYILRILDSWPIQGLVHALVMLYVVLGFCAIVFDFGLICLHPRAWGYSPPDLLTGSAPIARSMESFPLPSPAYFLAPDSEQTSIHVHRSPRKHSLRGKAGDDHALTTTIYPNFDTSEVCLSRSSRPYLSITHLISTGCLLASSAIFSETLLRVMSVSPAYYFKHGELRFDFSFISICVIGDLLVVFVLRPRQVNAWKQDKDANVLVATLLFVIRFLRIGLLYRVIRRIRSDMNPGEEVTKTIEVCDSIRRDMPNVMIDNVHIVKHSVMELRMFRQRKQLLMEHCGSADSKMLFLSASGIGLNHLETSDFKVSDNCCVEGPLGFAVYGAQRPSYSDCSAFVDRDSDPDGHRRQLIIFEALLGNSEDMECEEVRELKKPNIGYDSVQGGPWRPLHYHPEALGLPFRDVDSIVHALHEPKGKVLITAVVTYSNPDAEDEIHLLNESHAKSWEDFSMKYMIGTQDEDLQQTEAMCNLITAIEARSMERYDAAMSLCESVQLDRAIVQRVKKLCRKQSENLGISLTYLLSEDFKQKACSATGEDDPTFIQMKDPFFLDASQPRMGAGMLCPRDLHHGCSYVDAVEHCHRGDANFFLSWVWGYRLSIVTSGLQRWAEGCGKDATAVFFFMCFFCNNQWRILVENKREGSDDLETVFETRLRKIGHLVTLMDTWQDPVYTTRIWTIYEQYEAVRLEIPVTFALPKGPADTLIQKLGEGKPGITDVIEALSNVNAEQAKASRAEDEAKVKEMIKRDVGFGQVNERVRDNITDWAAKEFKQMVGALVADAAKGGPR